MSKKAEERAKEFEDTLDYHQSMSMWPEDAFRKGYEQAEKDLVLTWEDMKAIICIDEEMMDDPESHPEWMEEQPFYEEMLRRFNERKK